MKLDVNINNQVAELNIELNAKELAPHLETALNDKIANLEIDGFRKGKMPKAMFIKKYGISSVYPDAIDVVLNAVYPEMVKKNKLNVIAAPDFKWDTLKIEEKDGFSIEGTVDLYPEVSIEGYVEIAKKFKKEVKAVAKKDVDAEIDKLLENKANIEVKDGAAENGDIVVIDFEGFKDGVPFEGGKGENYPLTLGSNSFIPGFEEKLVGKKSGGKATIKVSFPDDYHVEDLKGAPVEFKCVVHEVKSKKTPKITAEILKDIKQYEATTKVELVAAVKEDLTKKAEEAATSKYNNDILEALITKANITAPKSMISQETDYTIENFKNQIKQQGMEFEMYIQMMGMTEEKLRTDIDKESKRKIEEMLVMEAVVKAENFKITKKEINDKIKELTEKTGMNKEEVIKALGSEDRLERDMKFDKAYKLVLGE
ncbi:MAG: trigger factor [Mycoplasmatales bacterium]